MIARGFIQYRTAPVLLAGSVGYATLMALVMASCEAAGAQANLPQAPQPQAQHAQSPGQGMTGQVIQSAAQAQAAASNPNGLTWDDVKAKFEAQNPTLTADQLNVKEMNAEEITAFLRPNPQFTMTADGTAIVPHNGSYQPLKGTFLSPNLSYLHERRGKRELRLESAHEGTQIAASQHLDLERNLIFGLRSQFVATLQAKAVLAVTKEELDYYDNIIKISRERMRAGDIAQIDFDRVRAQGYAFQEEILYRCRLVGCRFAETPIVFRERRYGASKINLRESAVALWIIFRLSLEKPRSDSPRE